MIRVPVKSTSSTASSSCWPPQSSASMSRSLSRAEAPFPRLRHCTPFIHAGRFSLGKKNKAQNRKGYSSSSWSIPFPNVLCPMDYTSVVQSVSRSLSTFFLCTDCTVTPFRRFLYKSDFSSSVCNRSPCLSRLFFQELTCILWPTVWSVRWSETTTAWSPPTAPCFSSCTFPVSGLPSPADFYLPNACLFGLDLILQKTDPSLHYVLDCGIRY